MNILTIIIILILVTPFHLIFIQYFHIWGITPSILTIAAATLCFIYPPHHYRIWIGFLTGLLLGTIAGANLSQYIFSYVITAYILHFLTDLSLEVKNIFYFFYTVLWSICSQIFLFFFAPPAEITNYLYIIGNNTLYNGFISIGTYYILGRFIKQKNNWHTSINRF